MGLKDTILACADTRLEPLAVPEWGVTLYLPTMTAAEADAIFKAYNDHKDEVNQNVLTVTLGTRTESGDRIFADGDVMLVAKKNADVIARIAKAFWKINGSDAEKNSLTPKPDSE